jgi:cytochrome b pre-mRNA-processing protein 3
MLNWFAARTRERRKAEQLYGGVVAGARQTAFYGALSVRDTPEGRFEMVSLMLFLVIDRLEKAGEKAKPAQQLAVEAFVEDMDDCMREMGIGDLSVPKRVRKAAGAFYERAQVYRAALAAPGEEALERALATYVYGGAPIADPIANSAQRLAKVVRGLRSALAGVSDEDMIDGRFALPAVAESDGP